MKLLCLRDRTIPAKDYHRWMTNFNNFIFQHTGLKPVFDDRLVDFAGYPTYTDSDGDQRPTDKYLKTLGNLEYDHIFMFVHENNWKSPTIWGTNYSYSLGDYHLHYCRWDKDNEANTFGTSYHEWMHALDALIKVELGEKINFDGAWDRCAVHGKCPTHDYIRYKENVEVLRPIGKQLYRAYKQRELNRLKEKVGLLQTIVLLRRKLAMLLNQKNGVSIR